MIHLPERRLNTGGDPRTLPDYAALRDELNKLTHPARPDVNWLYAEKLCLSLFEHNGVELQTAAWYTLARTQLAGVYGLNEGLAILEALITRRWGVLWPQPVYARMEILSSLNKRLQQMMRTLTLTYADLGALYLAEQYLTALGDMLQRLELKNLSQSEALRTLIHNAVVRLENSDGAAGGDAVPQPGIVLPAGTRSQPFATVREPADNVKWVYVAQPDSDVVTEPLPVKPWKPFIAGMFTMLVVVSASVWGWQVLRQPDPLQAQLAASLAPLPVALPAAQLQALQQNPPPAEAGICLTQQQLARLARLPPEWNISYGSQLVQQAQTLWPEQAKPLAQQWQQQLNAVALPPESLNGWHQGMMQLQQLTDSLNALDERRGRYLTGSELKTMVFAITQSFNRAVPVEEQLRLLAQTPAGQPQPVAQQSLTEQHLEQLIARYALLKLRSPGQN